MIWLSRAARRKRSGLSTVKMARDDDAEARRGSRFVASAHVPALTMLGPGNYARAQDISVLETTKREQHRSEMRAFHHQFPGHQWIPYGSSFPGGSRVRAGYGDGTRSNERAKAESAAEAEARPRVQRNLFE